MGLKRSSAKARVYVVLCELRDWDNKVKQPVKWIAARAEVSVPTVGTAISELIAEGRASRVDGGLCVAA